MEDRKIIGITMGDPASIGPEITVKALADQSIYEACRPIVVGDACVLEAALKIAGHEEMKVRAVKDVRDAVFTHGTIDVLDMGLVSMDELVRGQVSAMCGDAAFRYVEKVIELAMDGQVDATVTNAFNKEAVNLAGHHYSGHTEIYADLTGTKNYTMMLAHENMRVVHVSTHVSLREACDRVKKQRVLDVIRIGDKACREMGIENPRIAVAGLNPHSGEHGLFGQEEIREIIPAIEAARAEGIRALCPRILCSPKPGAAGMTSWWPCIMTRDTSPLRWWALSMTGISRPGTRWPASTSPWGFPLSVCLWTMERPLTRREPEQPAS